MEDSTYKCAACGEEVEGPAGYCDGCSQYYHLSCSVPSGEVNVYNCPNCAIQLQIVTLG